MNRTMTSKFAQSSNTNLAQTLFRTTSHTTAEVKNSGMGATVSSQLLYRGDRNWDCDGAESPIPSGHHPPSSRSQNLVQKRACARGHRLKTIKGRGGGKESRPRAWAPHMPARGACALRRLQRQSLPPPPQAPLRTPRTRKCLSSRKPRRLPNVCPSPTPPKARGLQRVRRGPPQK